jgi:LEA14-like dessication related protein
MNIGFFLQRVSRWRNAIFFIMMLTPVVIGGCASVVDQQLIDKPLVMFKGMSLETVSLSESTPVFRFEVTNPNPLVLKVRNIAYDLKINSKKFVRGVSDKSIRLKAAGSDILGLSVPFNHMELFDAAGAFTYSNTVAYDLSGHIRIGPFAVPYQAKGELEIPNLPTVTLKRVDVSKLAFNTASTGQFVLELKNANSFPVQVNSLKYRIRLNGDEHAGGIIRSIPVLGENSKTLLEIPLRINPSESGWTMEHVLTAASLPYEFSGELRLQIPGANERIFYFQEEGKVPVEK